MKKIVVVLALMSSSLFAQNKSQKPIISPQERHEKLVMKLNLDEQQSNKIQHIQKEHDLKLRQLKDTSKGLGKLMRSENIVLRKDLNIKMRAVLNKEQFADYKRMLSRKQMNKKRPDKKGKHPNRRDR